MMWPSSSTAFMSMPVLVEPTLTDEQTMSVSLNACGSERMSISSAGVMDLETSAEYPPIRSTPTCLAARSSACASLTKSSEDLQALAPTSEIGVTVMRLLTIGMP